MYFTNRISKRPNLSTKEKIRDFMQENMLSFDDDVVLDDDDNIFELGFVDSSFAMQLVSYVEEEFSIIVSDDDLDLLNFSTINRMVSFVERKICN
jgi:acyl carrier protein